MSVLEKYQTWRRQQRSANQLRTLSDRSLADIGLSRNLIDEHVRKTVK